MAAHAKEIERLKAELADAMSLATDQANEIETLKATSSPLLVRLKAHSSQPQAALNDARAELAVVLVLLPEAAPTEIGLLGASTPDATAEGRSCERVDPETLPALELKALLKSRGLSTKGDKGKLVQRMTDALETDGQCQCHVCAARALEEAEAAARTPDVGPTASESLIQITEADLLQLIDANPSERLRLAWQT